MDNARAEPGTIITHFMTMMFLVNQLPANLDD